MPYRESVPRNQRLFYVVLVYHKKSPGTSCHLCRWIWALEADEALETAIAEAVKDSFNGHRTDVWAWEVVCGEDFAEREIKGPPKEKDGK